MDLQPLKYIGLVFLIFGGCPWGASLHIAIQVLRTLLCHDSTMQLSPTTVCIWVEEKYRILWCATFLGLDDSFLQQTRMLAIEGWAECFSEIALGWRSVFLKVILLIRVCWQPMTSQYRIRRDHLIASRVAISEMLIQPYNSTWG